MPNNILVIDDDETILEVITIVLEDEGYEIRTDSKGIFFDHTNRWKPDLVLLDILLEGKSGLQICQQIKSDTTTKHIPVIFISAHTSGEVKDAADRYGADGQIIKPFDVDYLVKYVSRFVIPEKKVTTSLFKRFL